MSVGDTVSFSLGMVGWVLTGVCLGHHQWKVSTLDGSVITTSTIYENLWMSCASDSTGVYNCRDFLSLFGLSALSAMVPVSWYAFNITQQFYDPLYPGTRFELGPALYIGWAGGTLQLIGGICLCLACKRATGATAEYAYKYRAPRSSLRPVSRNYPSEVDNSSNYGKNAYV
ncbi:claudin-15-like isoform X1 [Leucoraja erinacea]|uniref:claudin-15-like isoform X1 n=1 Tax=Leucoraja erinaceus TaxID=7782 RepID=UPI0024584060|nr:claudin-15-like isoform X1 [Leucoraja erinacea]